MQTSGFSDLVERVTSCRQRASSTLSSCVFANAVVLFQLDTLKYTVERTASDLEAMKTNVTSLKKEIGEKQEK